MIDSAPSTLLFVCCLLLTALILLYNVVGSAALKTGKVFGKDFGKEVRRTGPVGDQTRGVVSDTVVNLLLVVLGAIPVVYGGYDAVSTSTLVPTLAIVSEVANFILDTGFRSETLGVLFGDPNAPTPPPPPACPEVYASATQAKSFDRMFHVVTTLAGSDVGYRSFLMILVNFMISTQFEATASKRLTTEGEPLGSLVPLLLWWLTTLLCSSLLNIVRFGWAYRATSDAQAGRSSVSSEGILLFLLLVALTYLGNDDIEMSSTARVGLAFSMLFLCVVGMTLGVFNVPACGEYTEAPDWRKWGQISVFLLMLLVLLFRVNQHRKKTVAEMSDRRDKRKKRQEDEQYY